MTPSNEPDSGNSPLPTGDPSPRSKTAEDWELIRRSIAMLPPGAWAMRREQALESLSSLVANLRDARHST